MAPTPRSTALVVVSLVGAGLFLLFHSGSAELPPLPPQSTPTPQPPQHPLSSRGAVRDGQPTLWLDRQWEAASSEVRDEVSRLTAPPCAQGFRKYFTTLLDPEVPFFPDPLALLAQAKIYHHQHCLDCSSTLYQYTRVFQGLGSRYHTHMCTLEYALREGRPFVSIDGGWIFTDVDVCADGNDHCFFQPHTSCPNRFCAEPKAKNSDQRCYHFMKPKEPQRCNIDCLCGRCGVGPGTHETAWARQSCSKLKDIPLGPRFANRTHLWWSSQLIFYLTQPAPWLQAIMRRDISDYPSFSHPIINIHVRRGRLKQPEMARFFQLDEYVKLAAPYTKYTKKVFLQTNDPSVTNETQTNHAMQWRYTEWNRTGMDLQIHNDPRKVKKRKRQGWYTNATEWTIHSFRNLWFMARSDFWICTYSSNWCRMALRLTYATYGNLPEVHSLDDWGFDPFVWYTNQYVESVINATRRPLPQPTAD